MIDDRIFKLNGVAFHKSQKEYKISKMSNSLNKTLNKTIEAFDVLINSDIASEIEVKNKGIYKAIVDYRRIKEPMLNALVREVWIEQDIMTYGDYIAYDGEYYLIRAKIEGQNGYDSSYMQICNQILKFKDINNKIHEIPTIVEKSYPSELDNPSNIVTLDTSRLNCLVGYSLKKSINLIKDSGQNPTKFIMGDKVWEVETVDKSSKMIGKKQGLYVLVLKKVTGCSNDDFENEIAKNVWDKDDVPENPDKEEKKELKIVGNDFIYQNLYADYSIENNADSLQFEWAVNDIELANIEKIENGTCRVRGNKKNKGYFILIAKNGDIELQKKIRVKGILDG